MLNPVVLQLECAQRHLEGLVKPPSPRGLERQRLRICIPTSPQVLLPPWEPLFENKCPMEFTAWNALFSSVSPMVLAMYRLWEYGETLVTQIIFCKTPGWLEGSMVRNDGRCVHNYKAA